MAVSSSHTSRWRSTKSLTRINAVARYSDSGSGEARMTSSRAAASSSVKFLTTFSEAAGGRSDACLLKLTRYPKRIGHIWLDSPKLVAVMRRNGAKAKDYAYRHKVPKWYDDAGLLINDPDINAIYIATPPSSHESYTLAAIEAGKPVYVEKPMAMNYVTASNMADTAAANNIKLSVAHYRRAWPLFKQVKKWLEEEMIGQPLFVRLDYHKIKLTPEELKTTKTAWRIDPAIAGGGLFNDFAPHQLDIMYWIFGAPQQTYVQSANQGKQYHAPDLTMVQLAFANDIYFNGIWNFNVAETATNDSCEIIGDKGSIRFSFFRVSAIELVTNAGTEILELEYPVNIQQPHINSVVKFFRGEGPNPCSLEEALVTMKVMDKAS